MDKINHCLNHNRFIPIDTEELSALELIGKGTEKTNELVEKSNEHEERITNNEKKKVSFDDMKEKYKFNNETDIDYRGKWFGLDEPTLSDEGMRSQVQKNRDDIEKHSEQLSYITNESINNLSNKNELILFSHRGCSDCPENTLFSIRQALKNGFKGIELDTRQCGSGEFVLLHDDTIDRTSNGSGSVSSKTLTELKQLDFGVYKNAFFSGVKIPTLEEALVECNKFDLILLEIKGWNTSEDIKKVAELIIKLNLENKVYCMGYNYESWKFRIREVSNKIKCVAIAGSQSSFDSALTLIQSDNNSTISHDFSIANVSNLSKCRQIGVEPILYTFAKSFEIIEKMNIGYKHFTTDSLGGNFYDNK